MRFMLIAGETSGDMLAAELVTALKASPALAESPVPPEFFGAGGPCMAAAGVTLAIDLTEHTVFGISDVLVQYWKFRNIFKMLFQLALDRQPDAVILVDFSGFNRRFAHALKAYVRHRAGAFHNWNPKIVYYVSPQVWASRESRAHQLARDIDLLLSIVPFEKAWYAARVPELRVEFVGHPLIDRYHRSQIKDRGSTASPALVLLLPGSRRRELEAHLPVMLEAVQQIRSQQKVRVRMVLPGPELAGAARQLAGSIPDLEIQCGHLAEALAEADLAIAASGTVTLECAYFRIPTVVVYRTSWLTYLIARQIVRVKFIAMPNILGDELLFPELIQSQVTVQDIAREAIGLLTNPARRALLKNKLTQVIEVLGKPGASVRAAEAILSVLPQPHSA